jgi:putative lipoic acid-binding regulatory protein
MTNIINFPCDFPIKIIGSHTSDFILDITAIILKHYPSTPNHQIIHKTSEQGNYTSITATIYCLDQTSLDALYQELTQYPGIKMVL